jgi:tetratricopeptide (TPR) repeat protein
MVWKNSAASIMEQGKSHKRGECNGSMHLNCIRMDLHIIKLGYCYIMLGMPKEALHAFEAALAWDPENKAYIDNKNNHLEFF